MTVESYVRRICRECQVTPSIRELAERLEISQPALKRRLGKMKKAGVLVIEYGGPFNGIQRFGVEVNGEWRYTRPAERSGRPAIRTGTYGATRIAFMTPSQREMEIAKLYDGRLYRLDGGRAGE